MSDLPPLLHDLDQALAALSEGSMTLSQLDGLIAGVLVCPEAIPPSEWLPLVWDPDGVGEGPPFETAAEAEHLTGLVLTLYNEVAELLLRDPDAYSPILDRFEATDETFWEFWIEGFEAATELHPDAWMSLLDRDEDTANAFALFITLQAIVHRDPELRQTQDQIDDITATAPELIPGCVALLARARTGDSARPTPVRRPKVGRNDPCPCGSGLKFKKCCGVAA